MEQQSIQALNVINNALSRGVVGGIPASEITEGYDVSAEAFAINIRLSRLMQVAGDVTQNQLFVDLFTVEYPEQSAFLTSTNKTNE